MYHPANPTDGRVPGSGVGMIRGVLFGIRILFGVLGLLMVSAAVAVGI